VARRGEGHGLLPGVGRGLQVRAVPGPLKPPGQGGRQILPTPSAAASWAGMQMQGFHPTVCGLLALGCWPEAGGLPFDQARSTPADLLSLGYAPHETGLRIGPVFSALTGGGDCRTGPVRPDRTAEAPTRFGWKRKILMNQTSWVNIIAVLAGTGLGGAITLFAQRAQRHQSENLFRLQQEATRQAELWQKGQVHAEKALDCLLKLREDLPFSAAWGRGKDKARDERCDAELEHLGRVIMLLTDSVVRQNLELAHSILNGVDDICQWGNTNISPQQMVWIASRYGIEVVSAYLRGEGASEELPNAMNQLKESYKTTRAEKEAQWEAQEQYQEQMRRDARELRQRQAAEEKSDGPTESASP
jgi:hypothetical protein